MASELAQHEQHAETAECRTAHGTPARPLLWAVAGAATMYLLDPERGRSRRARLRDQATGAARHLSHRVARFEHHASAAMYGIAQKMTHLQPGATEPPNDPDLVQRVESELFRDQDIPKGDINISAENGTVVLRGQLERSETIHAIERAVRKVHDVRVVRNLMHLPGTPAPNKAAALAAQRSSCIPPRRTAQATIKQESIVADRAADPGENPADPGEPDPARQGISLPVPGTGRKRKAAHMRAHDAEGEGGTFEKTPSHEHIAVQHP